MPLAAVDPDANPATSKAGPSLGAPSGGTVVGGQIPDSLVARRDRVVVVVRRPIASVLLLFVILFGLSLLVEPHASLGSDIAGKTATMKSLGDDGSVDLGYWAETLDSDGSLHPFYGTAHIGDRWVNATTFPMLLIATPLERVGGLHLAMLVPVIGGLLTASAAGAMARRLTAGDGSFAFWLVGLASPSVVYSLAFWEHSLGLGFMAWALVFIVESIDRPRLVGALLAGVGFGLAAAMRQEAMVYGFTAGLMFVLMLLRRHGVTAALRCGATMVVGTVVVLALNTALEVAILGESFRNARAGGAASGAGSDLGARLDDALLTTLVMGEFSVIGVAMGAVVAACLVVLSTSKRPPRRLLVCFVIPGSMYLVLTLAAIMGQASFVPSLLFSTPFAVASVASLGRRGATIPLFVHALVSLPVVFAFQSTGALEAQWGGRYLLLSGWALLVLAAVGIGALPRPTAAYFIALSAVVSVLGVAWTIDRSHQVASSFDALASRGASAIVFESPLVGREAGRTSLDIRSLSAPTSTLRREASDVLRRADVDSFDYVAVDEGQDLVSFDGFEPVSTSTLHFVGNDEFVITTFEAAP